MIVLSLFDGISCGRVALERAGIKIDKYYASEIDPYAEKISQSNYPDIIRLGDITKWQEWDIEKPDMIIAGSPCQGFSRAGKGLNFEDPRSKLFFVFADILRYYHPKYFLLENVKMKLEWNDTISTILGDIYPECVRQNEMFQKGRLEPVLINSALLSAQNRERLYWCNWQVTQPEDKGILLKDIIEDATTEKDKSYCIDASYSKAGNLKTYKEKCRRQLVMCGAFRGRNPDNPTSRQAGLPTKQMLEIRQDGKTNTLTTVQKDNVCVKIGTANINGNEQIKRVYSPEAKSPCLTTMGGGNREPKISEDNLTWRKLTPIECERLQTLPDGYCRAVSNSRAYRGIGNGWTVDVIAHIFKELIRSK